MRWTKWLRCIPIETVNIYPQRYYPQTAYTVDKATNTHTFKMGKSLYEAIVMVNGDATNKTGDTVIVNAAKGEVVSDPTEEQIEQADHAKAKAEAALNGDFYTPAWGD